MNSPRAGFLIGAVVALLFARSASAQERPIAFVGAEVIPISGPAIPGGAVVVHRGRILAVEIGRAHV